jgi:hypothetical protein
MPQTSDPSIRPTPIESAQVTSEWPNLNGTKSLTSPLAPAACQAIEVRQSAPVRWKDDGKDGASAVGLNQELALMDEFLSV